MSDRVIARPGVLQRAGRIVVWAMLAALFVAGASPAAAWDSYWDNPRATRPEQQETPRIELSNVPFTWVGFNEPGDFAESIAAVAPADLEASMAPALPPSGLGDLIASTAMSYLGYPYIYGGAGPGGFDCSGFTQYIVGITTGIWIAHAVEAQPGSAGAWVEYGAWQPGDLVFFQNTYRAGISHAAIYIGDGLIVHAENPSTGVTIDSIYSDYYGPRYWGAVRIG